MAPDEKTDPGMKTILLIEDDEISRVFLSEAISLLPVRLAVCGSFSEAEAYFKCQNADLIISDVHLPDGDLHSHYRAFPQSLPVLVTSAGLSETALHGLQALGYGNILNKPMSLQVLHSAIRQQLAIPVEASTQAPLWDRQKSGSVLGRNPAALAQLKGMFDTELRQMRSELQALFEQGKYSAMHDILHKLKASCGFLGASRLLQACANLDEQLNPSNLEAFLQVADQTLAAPDD